MKSIISPTFVYKPYSVNYSNSSLTAMIFIRKEIEFPSQFCGCIFLKCPVVFVNKRKKLVLKEAEEFISFAQFVPMNRAAVLPLFIFIE